MKIENMGVNKLTVKELINELKKMPQDAVVAFNDYYDEIIGVSSVKYYPSEQYVYNDTGDFNKAIPVFGGVVCLHDK